jgi:hypothetical protein
VAIALLALLQQFRILMPDRIASAEIVISPVAAAIEIVEVQTNRQIGSHAKWTQSATQPASWLQLHQIVLYHCCMPSVRAPCHASQFQVCHFTVPV